MNVEEIKKVIKNFDVKEGTHLHDFVIVISRNDDIRTITSYDMLFTDDFVWCLEEFENLTLKKSYMFLNNESGKFEVHLDFVNVSNSVCDLVEEFREVIDEQVFLKTTFIVRNRSSNYSFEVPFRTLQNCIFMEYVVYEYNVFENVLTIDVDKVAGYKIVGSL